ncbi:hypothetical protein BD626DRAFT_569015 [Schizophyllum amplum]|uniref:Uncharacterized protein n=1 Tax=Schizophyllum amplum TaxID=97359 RepID=A0A550CFQ3_9AGAR|nr:hypothetical protein BD626DRAFT_569015 [Auriculariopsis ampla]
MSDTGEDVLYGLYPEDVTIVQSFTTSTAITHTFFGFHTILYFIAAYLLIQQGLRDNRSRLFLFICCSIMFAASTAYMVVMNTYTQTNFVLLLFVPPDVDNKMRDLQIATNCLLRLNFMLSDAIVVWRAVVLYKDEMRVKWTLFSLLGLSYIGTIADTVLVILLYFGITEDVPEYTLLMTVPLLITNVAATAAIGYKTWGYKKMVGDLLRQSKRMTATELTMMLLVESGFVYCGVWGLTLASALGAMRPEVTSVLLEVLCIVSGLYPTLVIIIVALQKSVVDSIIGSSDVLPTSGPASMPSKVVPAYIPYQQTMQMTSSGGQSYSDKEKADSSTDGRRTPQDFSFA